MPIPYLLVSGFRKSQAVRIAKAVSPIAQPGLNPRTGCGVRAMWFLLLWICPDDNYD